jgi:hypothetical protein
MKTCPLCGVELEDNMHECPLCKYSDEEHHITDDEAGNDLTGQRREKFLSDFVRLTKNQKRKLFWEISGIILFSGILITSMIDLVTSESITWSRYTITVCLVLFVNVTLFSFLRHRLFYLIGGSFLSTSLLLILLDLYNERIGWGTQLGVPMLLSFYLIVFVLIWLIRKTKHHGFNVLGYFFLAVGLLLICTEGTLSEYLIHKIQIRWSLIVFASVVPIAAILFYIHYRLSKGIELKRFFHI